jgi:hypothetical protein
MAAITEVAKQLKDLGEVLEKLRSRRREIKSLLAKELKEKEEVELATELDQTSKAIVKLDAERSRLLVEVGRE